MQRPKNIPTYSRNSPLKLVHSNRRKILRQKIMSREFRPSSQPSSFHGKVDEILEARLGQILFRKIVTPEAQKFRRVTVLEAKSETQGIEIKIY